MTNERRNRLLRIVVLCAAWLVQSASAQGLGPCSGGSYLKADVTGDGREDLVHVYPDSNGRPAYWLWAGLPGGGFAGSPTHGYFDLAGASGALYSDTFLLGDINGDGLADLVNVYVHSGSGQVGYWAWLAQPNAGFATSPSHGYYTLGAARLGTALLGDINGDGRADLVQVYPSGPRTAYWAWLANPGTGFSTAISHGYLDLGSDYSGSYLLRDISGDGRADLVQVYDQGGAVAYGAWLAQAGTGFSTSISHGHLNLGRPWGGDFLLTDSNSDGVADLVQVGGTDESPTYTAWRATPGLGLSTTVSESWTSIARAHNFVANGDFSQWTGYSGPIQWSDSQMPVADAWHAGAGSGGTVTASWLSFPPGQIDVPGNPSKFLQLAWTTAPASAEPQHSPAFRLTVFEHFGLGGTPDVRMLEGQEVVISFYARVAAGAINLTPILWHSYDSSAQPPAKGATYELFESSGIRGLVAVAQGEPGSGASCVVTTAWQECKKVIRLPSACGKAIGAGHYTGAGFDFPAQYGPVLDVADFQVQPVARVNAFIKF